MHFPFRWKDLEAAYHITDIHEALALSEVGNDRKMFLFGTQVTENGSEIPSVMQDAEDLIAQLAADMQRPSPGPLYNSWSKCHKAGLSGRLEAKGFHFQIKNKSFPIFSMHGT